MTRLLDVPSLWYHTFHELHHGGVKPTQDLVGERFVWHRMRKDIQLWMRSCIKCQATKVQHHVRSPLADYEPPGCRFEHIRVDIVGRLPHSDRMEYVFTIVDRFTR